MRTPLLILFAVAAGLVLLVLWMSGGVKTPRTFKASIERLPVRETVDGSTSTLDVLTWNIAWGYGWGSEGSGGARPFSYFEESIERIGAVVRDLRPDLVLLQEVDFDADRSHGVDQALRIAEIADLPYVAPAVTWTANWVPFPYWPPIDQFGRMRSGGAILSRVPLERNVVTLLPKPDANAFHYNLFYPFRYFQRVEALFESRRLTVFNAHLEAFVRENREKQARQWAQVLESAGDEPLVAGGDFNTVPDDAPVKAGFDDESETSFEADSTYSVLTAADALRDAFAGRDDALTFPAHDPNRKLDHVLVSDDFEIVEARVVTEAGDVSDHLPLWVRLRLR